MDRTSQNITSHPEQAELFNIINSAKKCSHVSVAITTETPNCQLVNQLENPVIDIVYFTVNDVDQATLLIKGRKFYSFSIPGMKISGIESETKANGTIYRIEFAHLGADYRLDFIIHTEPTENLQTPYFSL